MTARAARPVLSATLRAAAVLAVLVPSFVVGPAATGAVTDPASPGPTPTAPAPLDGAAKPLTELDEQPETTPVSVRIGSITPQVLQPGQDLKVSATVTNRTDDPLENARVSVYLNRFRMFTRDEVDEWARRDIGDRAGDEAVSETLDEPLAPNASRTVTLTVPAAKVQLSSNPGLWGPRGMAVGVSTRGERLGLARTYVLWSTADDDPPQVPVSVVVPFVGPATAPAPRPTETTMPEPTPTPTPTDGATSTASTAASAATSATKELTNLTGEGGRLRRMLTAANVDDVVTLAVDPSLLVTADAGSSTAQRFAERLRTAIGTHETYVLPWADPDVAAVQQADASPLLKAAVDHPRDDLPDANVLLWSADPGTPDAQTLAGVRTAGAGAMVTGPQQAQGWSEALQDVATTDGDVPTIVPDATLTTLVMRRDGKGTPASTAQRVLADLAIVARSPKLPAGVVIAADRETAPDRETLAAVVSALHSGRWTSAVPLSTVLAGTSSAPVQRAPATTTATDQLSKGSVTALADAHADARGFAEILDDPQAYLEGVDDQVLAPLAVAWRADPKARGTLVRQTVEQVRERAQGLSIIETSDLNVIATTSDLRLTVRNDLTVPAHAALVVDPRKACLTVGDFTTPVLDPGDTAITVPLVAHANCDVVVEVALLGPSGQDVARPIAISARLSPTIESVGTVVVGILLALGLALGIVRTVRRGQSARRGARTVAEADAPVNLPVLGGTPTEPVPEVADAPATPPGPGEGPR